MEKRTARNEWERKLELEHGKKEGRKVVGKLKKGNGEKKHRK